MTQLPVHLQTLQRDLYELTGLSFIPAERGHIKSTDHYTPLQGKRIEFLHRETGLKVRPQTTIATTPCQGASRTVTIAYINTADVSPDQAKGISDLASAESGRRARLQKEAEALTVITGIGLRYDDASGLLVGGDPRAGRDTDFADKQMAVLKALEIAKVINYGFVQQNGTNHIYIAEAHDLPTPDVARRLKAVADLPVPV